MLQDCKYNECKFKANIGDIVIHEESECVERTVECCNEKFLFKNSAKHRRDFHEKLCPLNEQGCQFIGSAKEVESHHKRCPEAKVSCSTCELEVCRREMPKHYQLMHSPCDVCGKIGSKEIHQVCQVNPAWRFDLTQGPVINVARLGLRPRTRIVKSRERGQNERRRRLLRLFTVTRPQRESPLNLLLVIIIIMHVAQ